MIYLQLPDDIGPRRLPFYLAMEEWAAKDLPPAEYVSTWVVKPTVICGRNQDMDTEVDMAYCREHGIDVCRRRSGGGCVFADEDNVMISYIAPSTDVQSTFASFTLRLAQMLQSLGLDASATGRNDVLIGGRKVSGAAFYHLPGRSIVHSTMLLSTNMEHMLRAITPSKAKLQSKQVLSVASRITTLAEHMPAMTMATLRSHIQSSLSSSSLTLDSDAVSRIEQIEQGYYADEWLRGRRHSQLASAPRATGRLMQAEDRMPGVGGIAARLRLDADGRIADVSLSGDFFIVGDVESHVLSPLRGAALDPNSLASALAHAHPEQAVQGLTTESLAALLAAAQQID